MKKSYKVILSLALVLMLAVPLLAFAGCQTTPEVVKTLTAIALTDDIKTEYLAGEALDFGDAKLLLRYDNDTEAQLTLSSDLVTGFNTASIGSRTMTITYKEKSLSVDYVVKADLFNHKWCATKAHQGATTVDFPEIPAKTDGMSPIYYEFTSDNQCKMYTYNETSHEFDLLSTSWYGYKHGSLTELIMIYYVGDSAFEYDFEILTPNKLKFTMGSPSNYGECVMDYYYGI